jgi:DNA-binding LytR/AlgR family response regulator
MELIYENNILMEMGRKIIVKEKNNLIFVDSSKVFSIEKLSSKVKIVTSQKIFYSNKTLKEIEDDLEPCFFRLRSNIIINILKVNLVNLIESKVVMENKKEFVIAKRKKTEFVNAMEAICINLN